MFKLGSALSSQCKTYSFLLAGDSCSSFSSLSRAFAYDTKGLLSPAAQFWVMTHNLDASQIQGTGKGGRIMKYDVLEYMNSGGSKFCQNAQKKTPTAQSAKNPASPAPGNLKSKKYEDVQINNDKKKESNLFLYNNRAIPFSTIQVQTSYDMMMNIQKKLDDSVSFQTFVLQSVFHSLLLNKDILEEMYNLPMRKLSIHYINDNQHYQFTNIAQYTLNSLQKALSSTEPQPNTPSKSVLTIYHQSQSLSSIIDIPHQQGELGVLSYSDARKQVGYTLSETQEENKETPAVTPTLQSIGLLSFSYDQTLLSELTASSLLKSISDFIENPYLL